MDFRFWMAARISHSSFGCGRHSETPIGIWKREEIQIIKFHTVPCLFGLVPASTASGKTNAQENCHPSFGLSVRQWKSKKPVLRPSNSRSTLIRRSKLNNPKRARCGLGNDLERSITIHSVRGKAAAIQCKGPVRFQLFSQDDQSGVSEIHRYVAVSFH